MPRTLVPVDPAAVALALCVFVTVGLCGAAGAEPEAAEVLAGVQSWLDGTRDLVARFDQQLLSGAFGAGAEESGRLYLHRPGRMRWDYTSPEAKIALVDGDRTTLYLEEEGQLMLGLLDRDSELLPTLLAGDRRLAELFRVELAEADGSVPDRGKGAVRLRLMPQRDDDAFEAVVLTTRGPDWAIEAAEVFDAAGNRMLYRFSRMRRNRGLKEDTFRLEPPPGVEVSGSHEAVPGAS